MIITAIKWILVENVSAVLVCAVQCRVCAHQMKNRNKADFMQWFGDRTLLSICNSINPIRSKWMKEKIVVFLIRTRKASKRNAHGSDPIHLDGLEIFVHGRGSVIRPKSFSPQRFLGPEIDTETCTRQTDEVKINALNRRRWNDRVAFVWCMRARSPTLVRPRV